MILRFCVAALLLVVVVRTTAQTRFDGFPPFVRYAEDIADFIPEGWTLTAACYEDLDGDGVPDAVIAVRSPDPRTNWAGREEYPLLLIATLFDPDENCFMVRGWSTDILNPPNQQLTYNSFTNLSCGNNGELTISLEYVWSGGTLHTNNTDYIFRYMDGIFRLVRIESLSIGHHTGSERSETADFLSGRYSSRTVKTNGGKTTTTHESYAIEKDVKTFSDVVLFSGVGMNARKKDTGEKPRRPRKRDQSSP